LDLTQGGYVGQLPVDLDERASAITPIIVVERFGESTS
jgi:hypothetical protein